MGDLEKRLERLEVRTPPPPGVRRGHVSGAEIRRLEEYVKRLESGADEVGPAPVIKSAAPDEETAAVVRKIEWLEESAAREGRPL
jgi:plasmid replication initiation protein